ncbi:CPBP family intramembrane glutamic endopeptidase [Larkinella humicola]|uniref:CPBP family intramembrane metalloprotease n=1 Tax=Larkinella humicola TaxID=2607654 RepID=A0A5N1JKM2_9BACT|nr:CPBP family intramembrane metalloprotease [Larkinella humicola]
MIQITENAIFYKFHNFLFWKGIIIQYLVLLLLSLIVSYAFSFTIEIFGYEDSLSGADLSNLTNEELFLTVSIIAPILESFLFQICIIYGILYFTKWKYSYLLSLFVSSIVFGLSHSYNSIYMFYAFLIGLILAYAVLINKDNLLKSFLLIFLIHSTFNTYVYFCNIYL